MKKNKERRAQIKAWKKQQEQEFLDSIPFQEGIFHELFDYLDLKLESQACERNFSLTTKFLTAKGIELDAHRDFFLKHGGGCDCEILLNMEELFPNREILPETIPVRPVKRERLNALHLGELQLETVPTPWKLYKNGTTYELQLGKRSDIKIELIQYSKINNWSNDAFWQAEWESITELKVKSEKDVTYTDLDGFESITFKTQGWVPVLIWVRKKNESQWYFRFRTELSRLRGDFNELRNLLKYVAIKM